MKRIVPLLCVFLCFAGAAPAEDEVGPAWTPIERLGMPMISEFPHRFVEQDGVLTIQGFGHLYTRAEAYSLEKGVRTVIEFDARLHDVQDGESSELVVLFAGAPQPEEWDTWGGGEDLNFRIGCNMNEAPFLTMVRTDESTTTLASSEEVLTPDAWHKVRIEISFTKLSAHIDGREVVEADLKEARVPFSGLVGFLGYRAAPTDIKALRIRRVKN